MRAAVVIGGTGLVGSVLVDKLARDGSWAEVLVISRKAIVQSHPKVRRIGFDFANWPALDLQIRSFSGSNTLDFFCCLGTTIKAAGSEEQFRKVDHEYVVQFANVAERCSADSFFVVSSLGANPESANFYSRTKGEMEKQIRMAKIKNIFILRPSLLVGDRNEFRLAERLSIMVAPIFSILLIGPLKKYLPVSVAAVANTMVRIASKKIAANSLIENLDILRLGRN